MKHTYKTSGVNLDLARQTTSELSKIIDSNSFAAIIEHPYLDDFYLCSTTDGIGSKLTPLLDNKDYKTIANDLIAMNINDLACVGGLPIMFLDYMAVNKLKKDPCILIVKELKKQLQKYNCQLSGGEIAELPSIISENKMDIAGFVTGIVKKDSLLGKNKVHEGNVIIGLCSNGLHSNGFTLANKLIKEGVLPSGEALKPTHIYLNEILELNKQHLINACSHITGGGILENIERALPENLGARLDKTSLPSIPIFNKIINAIGSEEAFKVFNMGCGMCIIAPRENIQAIIKATQKFTPFILGEIVYDSKNSGAWFG